ncbi:pilus assembly protein PilP [Wenzhouxiangella sp. XN79A]|uniref:pilus assembly protein PilP n=1 Tax=Wenzhouxiangella sp. XN79A TaxID=2724193 RepID=UPI00144A8537|nr:pilus assembly protein PilP [Wenzhouxiangella sp. XN79A]NKI35302.1 pilus assembly protein PilP [Wenzhouxiangella sp. XN79A]
MRSNHTLMLGLAASLLLVGCGRGTDDLEQWVAQTLARPAGPVDPIPTVAVPETVTYDAYDLRDPFMRPRPEDAGESDAEDGAAVASGPRPDPDRRREYLERFPLDSLDMVGTIEIDDQVFGLISDSEGTIHRVREGNYLGQNHGRILQVTLSGIQVVELVPDGADGWMERDASIALGDESTL